MNPLKNNAQRAQALYIIFVVLLLITVVTILSDFMQANLLKSYIAGNIDAGAAEANDMRVWAISIVNLVAVICSIVFFIMWFRRAYNNLHLTGEVNLACTEGWAAGAWFVPFLNLVRPCQIMNEIWHKTQDATKNLLSHKQGALVGWWWGIYLVSNFAANIANQVYNNETLESMLSGTYAQIVCNFIEIVSIIITILLVKKTAEMEAKLYDSYEPADADQQEDLIGVV